MSGARTIDVNVAAEGDASLGSFGGPAPPAAPPPLWRLEDSRNKESPSAPHTLLGEGLNAEDNGSVERGFSSEVIVKGITVLCTGHPLSLHGKRRAGSHSSEEPGDSTYSATGKRLAAVFAAFTAFLAVLTIFSNRAGRCRCRWQHRGRCHRTKSRSTMIGPTRRWTNYDWPETKRLSPMTDANCSGRQTMAHSTKSVGAARRGQLPQASQADFRRRTEDRRRRTDERRTDGRRRTATDA